MWTINDFLFFGNYLGASLSSLHSCSTSQLRAKGASANSWKESTRPVLSRALFNFTFLSICFFFSCCNFNLLTKVCAEQETDRQSERAITARDDEMRIFGSLGAQDAAISFNIPRFITGFSFFTSIVCHWKNSKEPFFWKVLAADRSWPLKLFWKWALRPKSTFKLHIILYIHNPIFPSVSTG